MPVLARMLNAPLFIDVRPGAVASLATLLADRRISAGGQVAVVVGRGQGEAVLARLDDTLGHGSTFVVDAGTVEQTSPPRGFAKPPVEPFERPFGGNLGVLLLF